MPKKKEQRLGGITVTTTDPPIREKEPISPPVPIYDDVTVGQHIACGLRQLMFSLGDTAGPHGEMTCGAGLGSDAITMGWNGRKAVVFGLDLFKAWVATFDPESVKRMP